MKKIRINILKQWGLVALLAIIALPAMHYTTKPHDLETGIWRGEIIRTDGAVVPFNFEVKKEAGKTVLYIINGAERLMVDDLVFRNDSAIIRLPFFQSWFEAAMLPGGNLQGVFKKDYGKFISEIPFRAAVGEENRFDISNRPVADISGRWQATFFSKNGKERSLVGEFQQKGSRLTGTFLDPTGDYRYLEGVVDGKEFKLSGFDGGHVFLFTGKINGSTITEGKFYSGATAVQQWRAIKNSKAEIADGYEKGNINEEAGKIDFNFRDAVSGKKVSITDVRFRNKVIVIQILGSWCPNCMDETKFLSRYYDQNKQRGIEVIGLAYERTADYTESVAALQPFLKKFAVRYPILVTEVAVTDSLRTEKTLPQLKSFNAFPTTIFMDKKGNIRKVHSGFNGPATGKHFFEFQKEFEGLITALLKE